MKTFSLFLTYLLAMFFVFFVTYHIIDDTKGYSGILNDKDCQLVGTDKDLPQIKFYDCGGEIKLYRAVPAVNNK